MGGLGNQMFQYAAARRLAGIRNARLVLDVSHYENQPPEEVPRHYELDCFNISAKFSREPVENIVGKRQGMRKLVPLAPRIIHEKNFAFDREILRAADNILLVGYWQSEKYFKDYTDQLRKDFTFKDPLSPAKQLVANNIAKEPYAVSVQVRRGDYISHTASSNFHGALELDYYKRAVLELAKTISSPHFFVISDDPEWCKENLELGFPTTFVDHVPDTGHEDMRLTSLCKHHIIANSTFSWWGAWLNPRPNKLVIAPALWFKEPSMLKYAQDVVPRNWIRV